MLWSSIFRFFEQRYRKSVLLKTIGSQTRTIAVLPGRRYLWRTECVAVDVTCFAEHCTLCGGQRDALCTGLTESRRWLTWSRQIRSRRSSSTSDLGCDASLLGKRTCFIGGLRFLFFVIVEPASSLLTTFSQMGSPCSAATSGGQPGVGVQ
jgi:hypothetical protein